MQLPSVSVIIPTFNRVARVVHAIDSVLGQTYAVEAYEVIVVDDGSSDRTAEVLSARYGSRIRLLQQPNQGPSAARNRGIDAARYELIAFLDSDDCWFPNKLLQQIPSLNMPDVVLSYSNWTQSGRLVPMDRFNEIGLKFDSAVAVLDSPLSTLLRQGGSGILPSTCVVRKAALYRCGQFDERMKIAEDTRLWYRLALEGKFTALREPLTERGVFGGDNLTQTADPKYAREHARLSLELFLETYARAGDAPPAVLARLRHYIATSLYENSICYAVSRDYTKARRKAIEALAFTPSGLNLARTLCAVFVPSFIGYLNRWRQSRKSDRIKCGNY